MNHQTVENIIKLTQECLTRYWQRDCEFVLKHFDPDAVFIGSLEEQFICGLHGIAHELREAVKAIPPCHLIKQEYIAVQVSGRTCTVAGRFFTTTNKEADYFMQVQQRCTFTWEEIGGDYKIKQCHISTPLGEPQMEKGQIFPPLTGVVVGKYQEQWKKEQQKNVRIAVKDKKDVVHFLAPSDIVYVSASGRNSIIITITGYEIEARMSITEFMENADERFIMVHRSYVLNNRYISRIQKYEVIMVDGSRVPIPERRYKEVREELIK